ncbi:uncharacterized protein BX663DRAFT_574509 [Cokeromyces recurvatus]|uniref:uncharacterized protein n=1 Tax=Cokeromyces recurvatus TaxID=90255 RepID=UPI00221F6926|nr:uncharacterized protein BX663DRAFT_574509 [Cokeromyces recurvatus]KAI7900539.1 hypothetical protein BX663DRAFT_574509 [Cokeromyces recurvatus]
MLAFYICAILLGDGLSSFTPKSLNPLTIIFFQYNNEFLIVNYYHLYIHFNIFPFIPKGFFFPFFFHSDLTRAKQHINAMCSLVIF